MIDNSVYLAGFISTEYPESIEWRLRVAPILEAAGFVVLTPMKGKQKLNEETKDGGITTTITTSKSIILRDRMDVRNAKVILAHLENFGSPRPLLGTISELAWAWDQRTPVIGIAKAENYLMRQHPFLIEFISHYEETEDAAIAFLKRYYGPKP